MATNLDWTQSASLGYVPTFGSGTLNTSVQSANDVDISSLLRGDASASGSHSQSAPAEERRSSNGRVASPTQANTVSAVKPNESLTSEDPRMGLNIPTTPPRAFEQPFWSGPNGVSSNIDGLTGYQATLHEPERPKGPVKPKPVPSNPRLFRPFALNELQDTMLEHWRTPTVMGSYVLFPNKRLKYNPVPPKLELVREKLFRVEEPILLKSSQEVADYIPHVTNLWRNSVERIRSNEGGLVVEYWHCRSRQNKSSTPNANRAPKGVRNRDKKCEVMFGQQENCTMRVRVTSFTRHADTLGDHSRWGSCKCVPEWVHFVRSPVNPDLKEHTHDQEVIERFKHSEAIAVMAKLKVEEGNSSAAAVKWLRKIYGHKTRQAFRFEKVHAANSTKLWKEYHKDLVLRDNVLEDSEEMTTMRRCVDAVLEAGADPLRAALREVCKDSHDLTRRALAILEAKRPESAAPEEQEAQERWNLTEGAAIAGVSLPGGTKALAKIGAYLPPVTRPAAQAQVAQQAPLPSTFQGLSPSQNKRPIAPNIDRHHQVQHGSESPQGPPPLQWTRPLAPKPDLHPVQSDLFPQSQIAQPAQPRPQGPVATVNQAHIAGQPHAFVETRNPQQTRPPPPALGTAHQITVSLEIPSCRSPSCRQCKPLGYRGLAGRTFFFQGRFNTPSHFSQLQKLFSDPKQILDEDYVGILAGTGHMFAPQAPMPNKSNGTPGHAQHAMPASSPASQHPTQHQAQPSDPDTQSQSGASDQPPQSLHHPATRRVQTQNQAHPNKGGAKQHHELVAQMHDQSHASLPASENPDDSETHASRPPPSEEVASQEPPNCSIPIPINDQPLPLPSSFPTNRHRGEVEDDDDGDRPPAKRQRQQYESQDDGDEKQDDEHDDDP